MDLDAQRGEPLVAGVPGPGGNVRVHVWPALDTDGVPGGSRTRPSRRRRDESGSPVLLAFHGWTDGGGVFGPLAEALGRRWTVLAPDAPAHGGTPWRPTAASPTYRLDDQVGVGVAVLDALPRLRGRHSPVVTLGHSMGGIAAAGVAAARRRAVRHVVLEDPVGTRVRAAQWQHGRRRRLQALQALDLDARIALGRAEHPDWPSDELRAWAESKEEVDPAHLRVRADWGEPLAARLADVRCPVTLVRGVPARGALVSAASARRAAAVCRSGCEVVALDAGHNVRREARAPFVATLAAILHRYEP